jgi:hypothetical protein
MYFDKYLICSTKKELKRIKTSLNPKFNTWVVPCDSDAVCFKHGEMNFESLIIDNHILLSAYIFDNSFLDILRDYADEKNTHLIAPCYFDEINNKDERLDSGISISGKCKEKESFIDAMKREIAEEVGILIDKPAKKSGVSFKSLDNNHGLFYARDCKPYSPVNNIKFSDKKDLPRKKVHTFIIGSFDECKDLIVRSRELYPSTEINYGVSVIPINTIIKSSYISMITYKETLYN